MERPPCRPLALHVADPALSLSHAFTIEPDSSHTELAVERREVEINDRTLRRVAETLAATDVSYL